MKIPALFALLVLVVCGPLRAQPTDEAPSVAQATLKKMDVALDPLRQGDYAPKDRREILSLLTALQPQIAALKPPPAQSSTPQAEAWRKLSKSAADALQQENAFWAAQSDPASTAKLAKDTAAPLVKCAAGVAADFVAMYPVRPMSPGQRGGPTVSEAAADARLTSRASSVVARDRTRAAAAAAHPERFFDGEIAGGALVDPAVGARGGGIRTSLPGEKAARSAQDGRPVEPAYSLRTDAVPPPAAAPVQPKRRNRAVAALREAAPNALRDAVSATSVVGPPLRHTLAPKVEPKTEISKEELACRQASGNGTLAAGCGKGYVVSRASPILAGVVDAFKEQFSGSGLVMNLAFMIGGLLLGALTGGVGLLVTIVKALCGIALLATALSLISRLVAALSVVFSTANEDVRHWTALREVGKIGGELLIMVLLTFIGYKIGQRPAVKNAIGSMTEALQSTIKGGGAPVKPPPEMGGVFAERIGGNRSKIKPPEPPPEPEVKPIVTNRSLAKPESLKGATPEEIRSLIPKDWLKRPMRTGRGEIYEFPGTRGADIIQISEGNPGAPDALHQNPYVKIVRRGQTVRVELARK